MSYVYLLDLHKLINQRLTELRQLIDHNENDPEDNYFHKGQIDILSDFKEFLVEHLNPKLPKAIREKMLN